MNHQKIYEKLIQKAKTENRIKNNGKYYENHHIIPKCLNGNDEEYNKVLLTAREHFVSHKLLTYIYKGNYKIISAFNLMTFMNDRKYGVTSRDYQYVRELYANTPMDEETIKKLKKIIHTKEWNQKISNKLKNHTVSKETREKIGLKSKGRKCTEEAIENYKRGNKGKNIGVIHSEESRKRAGEKLKGKPAWNSGKKGCYSEESRRKMSEAAKNRKCKNE
jgi:hypothetical protein